MPNIRSWHFQRNFYSKLVPLFLTLGLITLITPPRLVQASTDPIAATISATARVPSSTPTTTDTTAPPPVILVSPPDNTITHEQRPQFVWKQTFDSNSNTVYYTLKLGGVATFFGISNTGNSQQSNYVSYLQDGQIYLTPTFDLAEGSYHWSVDASDASNNTSHSATWTLSIDNTAPTLILTQIDDLYPYPTLMEDTSFDLPGPQLVSLHYLTEPWATVSLTLTYPNGSSPTFLSATDHTGVASFNLDLPLGFTSVITTSIDHAGHTTTLPRYYLNLTSRTFAGLTLPRLPQPPSLTPLTSFNLASLPATITQITYSSNIILTIIILLAICISILLIIIWYRRYNILILDSRTQQPYRSLILYHSRPTHRTRLGRSPTTLLVTRHQPLLYSLPKGKGYIPRLNHYSSLTVRTPDGNTHIFSLSSAQRTYTITL